MYEYAELKSLQDLIDGNVQLTLLQRLKLGKQIAQAMAWLHGCSPPVMHGSLIPSNILVGISSSALFASIEPQVQVTAHYQVKVADFGLLPIKEAIKTMRANEDDLSPSACWHIAPELLLNTPFDHTVDQYA